MGYSRNLILLWGIFFVLPFLLSSQVAPSNAQKIVRPVFPIGPGPFPCTRLRYSSCIPRRRAPPKKPRCPYKNCNGGPPGKAGEFTNAQYKDDFHN